MKFTSFDKQNLNSLRSDMDELLKKYGVEANLEISLGNMRFTDASVDMKITAKIKGATTTDDKILQRYVVKLGLQMKNKDGDMLLGYKPKNWKMPFLFVSGNSGKQFKCDEATVKRLFAA